DGADAAALDAARVTLATVQANLADAGGVASVTVADGLPLDFRYRLTRVALPVDADAALRPIEAHLTRVGDDYLQTMGIPLVRGRSFTRDDRAGAEPVTVISRTLARTLFPDTDPAEALGKTLMLGA